MIDLHSHSNYSDGLLSATELIDKAQKDGVTILAISDHDNTAAFVPTYEYAKRHDIELIPAVEINTEYTTDNGDVDIHILGYFMDLNKADFSAALNHQRESRNERIISMVHRLNEHNINITADDVYEYGHGTLGRPHVAFALIKRGYAVSVSDAFGRYLRRGRPGYVRSSAMSVYDAIDTVRNAGGVPVIAHPALIRGYQKIIPKLIDYGVKGLEVFHPENPAQDKKILLDMVKKYNLLISGGSDFHGYDFGPSTIMGCPELTIEHFNAIRFCAN